MDFFSSYCLCVRVHARALALALVHVLRIQSWHRPPQEMRAPQAAVCSPCWE